MSRALRRLAAASGAVAVAATLGTAAPPSPRLVVVRQVPAPVLTTRSKGAEGVRFLLNHDGEIWRAVSRGKGEAGIGGPYDDVGVVIRPGPDSQPWERLQCTSPGVRYRWPNPISARAWTSNGRAGIADEEPKPRVSYSVPVRLRRLSRNRTRRTSYESMASRVA